MWFVKMRRSTPFLTLFLLCSNVICKVTVAETVDHFQLEPRKFDYNNRWWFIDATNTNDNHQFYNIFYFTTISYCLLIDIYCFDHGNPLGLKIDLLFQSSKRWIITYQGPIDGNFLYGAVDTVDYFTDPGCDKRLEFVYTDYLNVIVLLAGDSYSGLHIMVLRSNNTNLTYEQRMSLIEPAIKHLLHFKNLKKVQQDECITMSQTAQKLIANCTEFNANMKRKIISDMICKSLLLAFVISGLLCITINVVCWVVKRRNRAKVAPERVLW